MAEKRNLEPGMDESQAQKDRGGYTTTTENLTGGVHDDLFGGSHASGPVVGNNYDFDPLGEERDDNITHGEGDMKGSVGRPMKNDAVGKR